MDLVIFLAMVMMVALTATHLVAWSTAEKRSITSPHLRAAGATLVCFTILSVLVFGMRLFLKPDVRVTYHASSQDLYSNLTVANDGTHVIESKKLQTCDVEFNKSYPLFAAIGKDTRIVTYKMPCDALTTDMRGDISTLLSYLKEENRNAK
jgi:hypothetical protein